MDVWSELPWGKIQIAFTMYLNYAWAVTFICLDMDWVLKWAESAV